MTGKVSYTLLNPTGNMTLLAETPVPEAEQPAVAAELTALEPETEQVGFVRFEPDGVCLRMAGGEFCGNAAMSAAALQLVHTGQREGKVRVQVSGTKEPVTVTMTACPGGWRGSVTMPFPQSVGREEFAELGLLPVVRFPGITHLILEDGLGGNRTPEKAEELAPRLCSLLNADALGLMFLNREKSSLKPLVYVPDAGTLCWESSCASGTTAVGAFLSWETGKEIRMKLSQPAGELEISVQPGKAPVLTGSVSIVRRGSFTA